MLLFSGSHRSGDITVRIFILTHLKLNRVLLTRIQQVLQAGEKNLSDRVITTGLMELMCHDVSNNE